MSSIARAPETAAFRLPSWRTPANKADWIILAATGGYWLYQRIRDHRGRNRDTMLKFSPDDTAYYWLLRWLETMPRQKDLAVFRVMSRASGGDEPKTPTASSSGNGRNGRARLPMMVPTEGVSFTFRGVKCYIERNEAAGSNNDMLTRQRPDVILRIESRDPAISVALLQAIMEAGSSKKETPRVFVFQWGWTPVRACPTGRAAILPDGEYAAIAQDLRDFFESEKWYRDIGLAYRRGFLLHGTAGAGKTTTVIALAGDFGLNVCAVNLSSHSDQSLLEAVRAMPANSVLLLEDIDCAWNTNREAKDKLTFSGLLNVLDGAATPEGRVTFMTTNAREKLDSALIRPGRVDKEVKFTHATAEQIRELAARFSPNNQIPAENWATEQISMAQVQERLIQKYREHSNA